MRTRWESAERPLFVKTVIVNGSRHAILSPVDPLRQVATTGRRQEPPRCTCGGANNETAGRLVRSCYRARRDISSELQNCLVKLRVGLEQKRGMRRDSVPLEVEDEEDEVGEEVVEKSKEDNRQLVRQEEFPTGNGKTQEENAAYSLPKIKQSLSMTDTEEQTNKYRTFPTGDTTEELLRNCSEYFFPIVYIKANNLTWDVATADRCIARNVHNPLSDRVLQWLELTRRRRERSETAAAPMAEAEISRKPPKKSGRKSKVDKNPEEEVKQDEDVETMLSSQATDDGLWSNSLVSIPEKSGSELSVTEQLQQSILSSFEGIVNIDGKRRPIGTTTGTRRRGLPVKQTNLRMSSDEEDHWDSRRWRSEKQQKRMWECRRRYRQREESAAVAKMEMGSPTAGRRVWATEKGNAKPQLHIFMPEIDLETEDTGSESDVD